MAAKQKGNPFLFSEKWQGHLFVGKDIQLMWHVHFFGGGDMKNEMTFPHQKMTFPIFEMTLPRVNMYLPHQQMTFPHSWWQGHFLGQQGHFKVWQGHTNRRTLPHVNMYLPHQKTTLPSMYPKKDPFLVLNVSLGM